MRFFARDSGEVAGYLERGKSSRILLGKGSLKDDKSVSSMGTMDYTTESGSMFSFGTENDSHLYGADLMSTITGERNESMGGSFRGEREESSFGGPEGDLDILFAPAEHTDSMKRRKEKKRRERLATTLKENNNSNNDSSVPTRAAARMHETRRSFHKDNKNGNATEEADGWYNRWGAFCYSEALQVSTAMQSCIGDGVVDCVAVLNPEPKK